VKPTGTTLLVQAWIDRAFRPDVAIDEVRVAASTRKTYPVADLTEGDR
jgi:hypothetical protein